MIYFKKIRWKNFISTGNTFTEIDFTRNKSTLIVGENGAGKSTILDALCFALYGRPFRKVNKPQLINSINGKNCVVELEFSIGSKDYKIVRGIKPTVFEIFQDTTMLNQNAEAREYQEMFERNILKLNFKSFSQIVILGSASFVPFMQLPSAHRREVIEDLLDIQIFSVMNNVLKDKISENKSTITETDFQMRSTGDKIELYKKHVDSLKQNNEEVIAQKQARIDQLNVRTQELLTLAQQKSTIVNELQDSISSKEALERKEEKMRTLKRKLHEKYVKHNKEVEFFESHDDCPTCKQNISDDFKKSTIGVTQQTMEELSTASGHLQTEYDNIVTTLEDIKVIGNDIANHQKTIMEYQVEVNTNNKFVKSLTEEIDSLKTNNTLIDVNTEEINVLKAALRQLLANKESLVNDRQVLDVAGLLLRDTGIKTKIIKQYIPIMNKLINKYLASMDFFVNFELNENFEETIKSRFRDEFTYASFSEGEKMRIDLALLFTWRAVAKLRNSTSTNLLIMDEVFDSSLDNTGTDEFLKIIQGLAGDTNIFIISHKGDQLYDKFHSVIKFEKHKNFSRIVA